MGLISFWYFWNLTSVKAFIHHNWNNGEWLINVVDLNELPDVSASQVSRRKNVKQPHKMNVSQQFVSACVKTEKSSTSKSNGI